MRGDIQLEKGVRNLQHQNVWMVVLVADQDALAGSAHAMLYVVLFQSLQAREHRGVLLWLMLFGTKGVIAKREEADGGRLIRVECFGQDGSICVMLLSDELVEPENGQLGLTGMRSAARSLSL